MTMQEIAEILECSKEEADLAFVNSKVIRFMISNGLPITDVMNNETHYDLTVMLAIAQLVDTEKAQTVSCNMLIHASKYLASFDVVDDGDKDKISKGGLTLM